MLSFRNPDYDFVLHGRKTPIRLENPKLYHTNSERTLSTSNLSQSNNFSQPSSRNVTLKRSQISQLKGTHQLSDSITSILRNSASTKLKKDRKKRSNGEFSLDLQSLNSSLNRSLNKNVSFSEYHPGKIYDDDSDDESLLTSSDVELQQLIDQDFKENEEFERNLAGKPQQAWQSKWFTEPIHLSQSCEFPVFESLGVSTRSISPPSRTVGILGTELAQKCINSEIDTQASGYFPVTLSRQCRLSKTVSEPLSVNRSPIKSRNTSYAYQPQAKASKDYNYLVASQPFVDGTEQVSPYRYEIAKLRMERLRLEEDRLLESKRQNELERIRGPTPKWYELKTPQFCYEAHKNNGLLKSEDQWQNLLEYRQSLIKSSRQFQESLY